MKFKSVLALAVLSSSCFAQNADWFVEINHNDSDLFGSGYIVQIGDHYYVKTASHVTLGGENVTLETTSGRRLTLVPNQGVSSTDSDDQLIRIAESDINPLGIYSPDTQGFVVPRESAEQWRQTSRRLNLESDGSRSYISPDFLGRDLSERPTTRFVEDNQFNKDQSISQGSASGDLILSQARVMPGESGGPSVREGVVGVSEQIPRDLNGNPIDLGTTEIETFDANAMVSGVGPVDIIKTVPTYSVIDGQVSRYDFYGLQSRFTSNRANTPALVEALQAEQFGPMDDSRWEIRNGDFFRVNGNTVESIFLDGGAGGTSGGGGGTSGGGAGGTSGGGAGGTSGGGAGGTSGGGAGGTSGGGAGGTSGGGADIQNCGNGNNYAPGMIYKGQQTEAFIINRNGEQIVLSADWRSATFVSELQALDDSEIEVTPVPSGEGIASLIEQKLSLVAGDRAELDDLLGMNGSRQCTIRIIKDGDSTSFEVAITGLERFVFDPASDDYFVIQRNIQTGFEGEIFHADLRGLYSVNPNETSNSFLNVNAYDLSSMDNLPLTELNFRSMTPSIKLGRSGDRGVEDTTVNCYPAPTQSEEAIFNGEESKEVEVERVTSEEKSSASQI